MDESPYQCKMGATKVGELETVNAVLRRALKPEMP